MSQFRIERGTNKILYVMNSNSNELLTSGLIVDYFVLFHHGVEGECYYTLQLYYDKRGCPRMNRPLEFRITEFLEIFTVI